MDQFKKAPEKLIALGLVFGVVLGAAIDNIGLGIALGLVFGAGLSEHFKKLNKKTDDKTKE